MDSRERSAADLAAAAESRLYKFPDLQVGSGAARPGREADDFGLALHPQTEVIGARIGHIEHHAAIASIHFADLQGCGISVPARGSPVLGKLFGWIEPRAFRSLP